MAAFPNFVPRFGAGLVLTASGVSSSGALFVHEPDVRICNANTVPIYVRWGVGAQTALATDLAIMPGAIEVFSKGIADTIAVLSSGASGTVYAIPGNGT